MSETPTSYSLLVMYKDVIYAVRDPYGNRPLCIGRLVPISKLHNSGNPRHAWPRLNSPWTADSGGEQEIPEGVLCHRSH